MLSMKMSDFFTEDETEELLKQHPHLKLSLEDKVAMEHPVHGKEKPIFWVSAQWPQHLQRPTMPFPAERAVWSSS